MKIGFNSKGGFCSAFSRAKYAASRLMIIVAALSVAACVEEVESTTYADMEQELFDRYMEWKFADNTELLESRTSKGYYFLIDDSNGATGTTATNVYDECWLRYNIVTRNFTGDDFNEVNLSTYSDIALQQQTFSFYTHYVPTFHTLDEEDTTYDSALDYILRDYSVVEGDQLTIYGPSTMSYGLVNGAGGYAGSATLSYGNAFHSVIDMVEVITDIDTWESEKVTEFVSNNPTLEKTISEDDGTTELDLYYYSIDNPNEVNENGLGALSLTFTDPYDYSYILAKKGYTSLSELETELIEALETFTQDEITDAIYYGATTEFGDSTKLEEGSTLGKYTDANIWYVGRMMDGFIFDSNIENVRNMMFYDYTTQTSTVYNADDDGDSYIEGWYHIIPKLKYGSWNVVLLPSDYAYGSSGVSGSSSSTEIKPYSPLIFYVYIEPNY